jgi:choice-of-anchor A domain-containing protein
MKKNIAQRSFTGLKSVVATGLLSLTSVFSYAQCDAVNQLLVPDTYMNAGFGGDGNFNAVVLGNYTTGDGGRTSGRLLVGGNFTFNSVGGSYQVGVVDSSPVDTDNLIVDKAVQNSSGGQFKVRGNAKYGSLTMGSAAPTHAAGEGNNSTASGLFDLADLKTYYQDLSNTKAALPTVGTVNVSGGVVTLTGTGSVASYVFNVTLIGDQLTDIVYSQIPVGSDILINISNEFVTIAPATGSSAMSIAHRKKTLFNFPAATQIEITSFSLEGSMLAPKAILYAESSKVNGNLVIGSDIQLASDFSINTACPVDALPVTLSSFSARREGVIANISWETTFETAADRFVVERSSNAKEWNELGIVKAAGESSVNRSYNFSDLKPQNKANLYRLKMIDLDGSFAYSRMININFDFSEAITVYPNPVAEKLSINTNTLVGVSGVEVTDYAGKVLVSQPYDGKDIVVKNWPAGLYLIKLTGLSGVIGTYKIVKN